MVRFFSFVSFSCMLETFVQRGSSKDEMLMLRDDDC